VDTEVAPKKQEAKLTDYMKMVINLLKLVKFHRTAHFSRKKKNVSS
jgi:hypothetical protein